MYNYGYQTPSKIPTQVNSRFLPLHDYGEKYFELCSSPVIIQLEKIRRDFENTGKTPYVYLNSVINLFMELDVPLHRKASALMRYLPAEMLANLGNIPEANNALSKFIHYFQNHDWMILLRILRSEKGVMLSQGTWDDHKYKCTKENEYYTDTQMVPTPESAQSVGYEVDQQTPVNRKRPRPSPEVVQTHTFAVCPSLVDL